MTYSESSSKNESVKQFAIMPRAVVRASISTTARIVYAELASYYWGDESFICPAYSTIAAAVGLSRITVIRAVKELVENGFLEKQTRIRETRGGYGSNVYILRSIKNDTSRSIKNDTSRSIKNDTMNNTENHNKNNILKNIISRARARAKNAAAEVHDTAENMSVTSQDLQVLEIFKQAKNARWFELVRINQAYCLRPYSSKALSFVSNADFNELCNLITSNAGSCRPLNVGQHFLNEVIIK